MRNLQLVVTFLNLFYIASILSTCEEECSRERDSANAVSVFINSKRNQTGDWVTHFSLTKDDSNISSPNNVTLNLSQAVTECRGRRSVQIRGVLSGFQSLNIEDENSNVSDKLLFHTKCGSNVAVLNDGRTIRKINLEVNGNGVAFTHRPLKINEILEVKLEKKHNKFGHSFGIGVTTLSPLDASQIQHINSINNASWAWYNVNTYLNGNEDVKNYGQNTNLLEVGERVGVRRSNTGSLHYYWNGVDQGPAASNVPHPVYGVVELCGNAAMASMVYS